MDRTTARPSQRHFDQGDPTVANCDVCRHQHACYVGGRPDVDEATGAITWERHICLGCVMRAAEPDGRPLCADCVFPARDAA